MRNGSLILEEGAVRVSDHVRIRQEHFGGIVFHTSTGDTLEVDHGAYKLLTWLREIDAADIRPLLREKHIRTVLPVLLDTNTLEYHKISVTSETILPAFIDDTQQSANSQTLLSAPETVHLAVTYRCYKSCPDCYARGHISVAGPELDTAGMCCIIDTIADNGVFQLAIGGGEPFARTDLCDIVCHAVQRGLVVHITTGQHAMKSKWVDTLRHIKSLHIGIQSEELINDAAMSEKLRILNELDVPLGANLILTRFTIQNIEKLTERLLACGFKRLIFLRYKPIADHERWNNENPGGEELRRFNHWLARTKQQYPRLMLRIDCAAAFLMRDLEPQTAIHAGIRGCVAGERILSVAPDGFVYPCSQLVGHAYLAGNLAKDSLKAIWHDSDVLRKYRSFRQNASYVDSVCGRCDTNLFCGGCRVFANGCTGGEPFCPLDNL